MSAMVSLLLLDLDLLAAETSAWAVAYDLALESSALASGVARGRIEAEVREEHRRQRSCAFLADWRVLPCFREAGGELAQNLDGIWRRSLRYYARLQPGPGVELVLRHAREAGGHVVVLTAETESVARGRLDSLQLTPFVSALWRAGAPDRTVLASGTFPSLIQTSGRHAESACLRAVVGAFHASTQQAVYVGQCAQDVAMAAAAGVQVAWARYAEVRHPICASLLERLGHPGARASEPAPIPFAPATIPRLERSLVELLGTMAFGRAPVRLSA